MKREGVCGNGVDMAQKSKGRDVVTRVLLVEVCQVTVSVMTRHSPVVSDYTGFVHRYTPAASFMERTYDVIVSNTSSIA